MKTVRITVLRKACYPDLIALYERPEVSPCEMTEGAVFRSVDAQMPQGFCENAWEGLAAFVRRLAEGETKLYGDWMKDERSALLSCNDGFRPVSFLLETES